MDKKPKVSPSNTYILYDEDIAELDDSSLTSIVRSATISQRLKQHRPESRDSSAEEADENDQEAEEDE